MFITKKKINNSWDIINEILKFYATNISICVDFIGNFPQ